jgi:3'-phosphoadenosine 5'-phosphosulfate (PAPS) 3'-phosphatase
MTVESAELAPEIPVISEVDHAASGASAYASTFWLVDPLDSTKDIKGTDGLR